MRKDTLTWIVAIVGIILFLSLSCATVILWDQANPEPKSPDTPLGPAGDNRPAPGILPDQVPWIRIDPMGSLFRGDQITISGITGDPARHAVSIVVTTQEATGNRVWAGNTVDVLPESGNLNRWSFVFDSASFPPSGNVVMACIVNTSPPVCVSRLFSLKQPLETLPTPAGCWQRIDPVTDHAAGEVFVISGNTDCRPGDRITVEIVSVPSGTRDYTNGSVEIQQRSDNSFPWAVVIDSSPFEPGQKTVSACGIGICGFRTFNITEKPDGMP